MIIKKFINGKIIVEKHNETHNSSLIKKEEQLNIIKNQNESQNQTVNPPKKQITYYQKPSSLPPQRGGCGCGGR